MVSRQFVVIIPVPGQTATSWPGHILNRRPTPPRYARNGYTQGGQSENGPGFLPLTGGVLHTPLTQDITNSIRGRSNRGGCRR